MVIMCMLSCRFVLLLGSSWSRGRGVATSDLVPVEVSAMKCWVMCVCGVWVEVCVMG